MEYLCNHCNCNFSADFFDYYFEIEVIIIKLNFLLFAFRFIEGKMSLFNQRESDEEIGSFMREIVRFIIR